MINLAPLFFPEAEEASYEISEIEGRLPEWLRGSHYVNGPARFERAGMRYKHWLDGDGMVCRLSFGGVGADFASRYVRAPKVVDEDAAGRFLYRGFGTAFEGDKLRRGLMLEPPINVSAYPFAGELLAFGEQSLPYRLDPITLQTLGEADFKGSLNEITPFSAHPKFDPRTGGIAGFGVAFSSRRPTLNLFEFGPAGDLKRRRRHRLDAAYSLHDCAISEHAAVFHLGPLLMDFGRFQAKGVSVLDALSWEPERGSRLLVFPRGDGEAFEVSAGNAYCLHLINAWEQGRRLNVDLIETSEPLYPHYTPLDSMFQTVPPGAPVRLSIDLDSKKLVERHEISYSGAPDFPAHDPNLTGARCDEFWMLGISRVGEEGPKFFDELLRGDFAAGELTNFRLPVGEYFGGEPAPVYHEGEVAVIVQWFRPAVNEAAYWVFDGRRFGQGPVARLPLRSRITPGFHSSWRGE